MSGIAELIQQTTQRIVRGGLQNILEANREEILRLMADAQTERGAALLHSICEEYPLAAGVVQYLMTQSPEQSIAAVRNFDPKLADGLQSNMSNFRLVQAAYVRGQQ